MTERHFDILLSSRKYKCLLLVMNLEQKDIEFKTSELEQLAQELLDLQELMADFGEIIHSQGVSIDRVAENVSEAEEQAEVAIPELKKAEISQFKGRRRAARLLMTAGGGLVGSLGFLLNPIVGIGATAGLGYGSWVKSKDIRRN